MRTLPHVGMSQMWMEEHTPLDIHLNGMTVTNEDQPKSKTIYYLYSQHFSETVNSIIQSLWDYLNNDHYPGKYEELHVSFDNKATQHNNYFFAFCYYLIKLNWFQRITLIYTIAGEGYSRTDQAHRVLRSALWHQSYFDIQMMVQLINHKHIAHWLQKIFNWQAFFDEHGLQGMKEISGAHQ
jgi:hypothetical protein